MSEEELSKTRRKRQMQELQDLGERLLRLNADQLARLELPDRLREALQDAKRMKSREALRRQLQYVGRIMREVDAEPIRAGLETFDGKSWAQTAWLHLLERWRERLLADERALGEFLQAYPGADLQRLRTLVRAAHKEQAEGKPPRSFRAIFDELRALIPSPRPAGTIQDSGDL
jgi:ribosome-associated protein